MYCLKPLSDILTVILSLLVAIPLCCCSAKAGNVDEGAGCCQTEQSGKTGQEPMLCACESHDAKDKPEKVRLPGAEVTDITTPDADPSPAPLLRRITPKSAARPWITVDQPSDVFAQYSRWII
jgi:hypothetical protein